MDDIRINYFNNLTAKRTTGTIKLKEYADSLRFPAAEIRDTIAQIRCLDKSAALYNILKTSLPCFFLNARTKHGSRKEHLDGLHPLLFLDIDGIRDGSLAAVRARLVELLPSIVLLWRSVGGKGLGVLLHVEGLTSLNLPALKAHLCTMVFEGSRFDRSCFNFNRKTVHSYDQDMYINWAAPAFDWSPVPPMNKSESAVCSKTPRNGEKEREGNGPNSTFSGRLRFDNAGDFFTDDVTPHLVFPEKVALIQVERRWTKISNLRNQWLFNNLVRLKWLNKGIPLPLLMSNARTLNRKAITEALEEREVRKVALSVFNGDYTPTPNVLRRVLFNPRDKLSGKERQALSRKLIGASRTEATKRVIYEAIEGYIGAERITARLISTISGLKLDNVKRKWPEFREYVKGLNEARAERPPKTATASAHDADTRGKQPTVIVPPPRQRQFTHPHQQVSIHGQIGNSVG